MLAALHGANCLDQACCEVGRGAFGRGARADVTQRMRNWVGRGLCKKSNTRCCQVMKRTMLSREGEDFRGKMYGGGDEEAGAEGVTRPDCGGREREASSQQCALRDPCEVR